MAKIAKKKTRLSVIKEDPTGPVGKVKHLDQGFSGFGSDGSGVWDSEIKAFMEASTLKGLFFSEDWVFMLLDLIADSVSSQPMIVKKSVGEENGKVIEETIDDHPALTLLQHPNEFQEYSSFIYNYTVEFDLMGNAIVFYAKSRQNMMIIPAETVNLRFDRKGKLVGYQVLNEAGIAEPNAEQTAFFAKKDVWHQRRPNPNSLHYGLSPFIPARKNILFNRYTQDWLNSFYLKGATPTVALSMEKNTDEKSALRFLRSFEMAYTGRRNMRRPLVLPKGVSVESLSPSVADQQLIELVNKNRENIINILRVPKHALSLAESGSLGSEEHKQALKFFWSSVVIPTQKKISDHFTRNFRANFLLEEDERLEFDNSEVELLRDDLTKKAELSEKMLNIFTPNEIRKDLWDKEPIEGGDKLGGSAPALPSFGFGGNRARTEAKNPEGNDNSDLTDSVESEEDETKAFVSDDDLDYQGKDYREGVVKGLVDKYVDHLATRAKQNIEVIEGPGEKAVDVWKEILKTWSKDALKLVAKELRKAPGRQHAKAEDHEAPTKIPSKRRLRKLLERDFTKEESKWLDFVIDDFSTIADESFDLQVAPITGEDNVSSIASIKERDQNKRRRILSARAGNAFADISKTQIEAIMKTVEKGIEEQTPLRDIGKMIEQRFENIGQKRAETIARTEALTAVSVGKQAALEGAKEVIGEENLVKVWINLGDLRVRGNPGGLYPNSKADHWSLQGETREVDEPFANGLMYPRDLKSGDPSEVINCFLADTEVTSHTVKGAFSRIYNGPVATVIMSSGERFTGTPNHPMMTTKGWVALGELDKTHKLIKANIGDSLISRDEDIGTVPTKIGEFFASFSDSRDIQRVGGTVMDFHGDGIASDVDIVLKDSLLMDRRYADGSQSINDVNLHDSNLRQRALFSGSGLNESVGGITLSHGSIGSSDLTSTSSLSHAGPFNQLGGGPVSLSKAEPSKVISDKFTTNTEPFGKFLDANGFVNMEAVQVSEVVVTEFIGHVFNLSTINEMYLAQGFVTHNCRCDFLMVPKEDIEDLQT